MILNVPEGKLILKEGESNKDMYKILSGSVEIYSGYGTDNESILGIKSTGNYFGEMGLFSGGKPAIYTVIAFSNVVLRKITEQDIDTFILENHGDVYRIMKNMANTMYGIKFSMDMIMKDMLEDIHEKEISVKNNTQLETYRSIYSKQFAKFNAGMVMDTLSRYNENSD
ncbi:MAG: cyclic nucleotide-binding domain-containing protein [Butyrivibrio sp.]|nr:cyclic nucleotide-binding domain-containing protein [Butyrivibrio sp.]